MTTTKTRGDGAKPKPKPLESLPIPSAAPQSAAAPSPFTPIADYAFLSNCHTGGSDPATSVLNRDCRAHELDNLYVADTSIFLGATAEREAQHVQK